jgi:hypothetical protein
MSYHILHVFPSDVFTGTVAHVLQLAEGQEACGHRVLLVTDMPDVSDKFPSFQVPVTNRSFFQRLRNVRELIRLIRTHPVDIIHSHSRAASWIAYYAAWWTNLPQVATIHGRQHKHNRWLRREDIYGSHIIGICPNLVSHLKEEIGLSSPKMRFIPNGIDFTRLLSGKHTRSKESAFTISVISRFNGVKGKNISILMADVFPFLLKHYPNIQIQFVGGEWEKFPAEGKNKMDELRVEFGNRIAYLGFHNDVLSVMANSDLVIGSGWVAIESALLTIPVMVLGEACYHGFLGEENIREAVNSNFGDILPQKELFLPDAKSIQKDLETFLKGDHKMNTDFLHFLEIYDLKDVVEEIIGVYRKAILQKRHPKHIPVLLYHKVTDDVIVSKHRTYVTRQNFGKQMHHLALRGMTPVTFKEYEEFLDAPGVFRDFPRKPVILTFDDGYADNYRNVLPVARKFKFKGVLFLMGDDNLTHNSWDIGEDPEANKLLTREEILEFIA